MLAAMLATPIALGRADLQEAAALMQTVGWLHTPEHLSLLLDAGRGFQVREHGEMAAVGFCANQGGYTVLGAIAVSPQHQRKRLGRVITQACIDTALGSPCMLVATDEGLGLYKQMGFVTDKHMHAYVHRMASPNAELQSRAKDAHIRQCTQSDIAQVVEMQSKATGMDRSLLVRSTFGYCEDAVVYELGGSIVGSAFLIKWPPDYRISQIAAQSVGQATAMAAYLLSKHAKLLTNKTTRLDTFEHDEFAKALTEIGFVQPFDLDAMANGPRPRSDPEYTQYAVALQTLL